MSDADVSFSAALPAILAHLLLFPATGLCRALTLPRRAWVRSAAWIRTARTCARRQAANRSVLFGAIFCICLSWLPAQALEVNLATATELQTLRGVGPKMAERVIQERERAGPYTSLDDLSDRVRGIGAKRLASFRAAGLTASTSAAPKPAGHLNNAVHAAAPRRANGLQRSK